MKIIGERKDTVTVATLVDDLEEERKEVVIYSDKLLNQNIDPAVCIKISPDVAILSTLSFS